MCNTNFLRNPHSHLTNKLARPTVEPRCRFRSAQLHWHLFTTGSLGQLGLPSAFAGAPGSRPKSLEMCPVVHIFGTIKIAHLNPSRLAAECALQPHHTPTLT